MNKIMLFYLLSFIFIGCNNTPKYKVDTYDNLKKELDDVEQEKRTPIASIGGLESEVNNGGLNQYFFNSTGQDCFETMRELENRGKLKTAKILQVAIKLINPNNLSEAELIEKIRKREVKELDDSIINLKLDSLDNEFYSYPDGDLR